MDHDERSYDKQRFAQWLREGATRVGMSRRAFLQQSAGVGLAAGVGAAVASGGARSATAAEQPPPIVKPTPENLFSLRGTNAEMR